MDPFSDENIRQRAQRIWEREGRPEGRADEHWQMARSELAAENLPPDAMLPNPIAATGQDGNPHPEPVEPLEAAENQGSFPALTDQDEEQPAPPKKSRKKS